VPRGNRCRACSRTRPATGTRGPVRSRAQPTPRRGSIESCSCTESCRGIRASTAPPTSSTARADPRMARLAAHGVAVDVPRGWEGRILRRTAANPAEQSRTVMHVASFPLPEARGDFGVGVTELMRSGDVFVSLFEYGPESLGQPLFAAQGV